MSSFLDKPPAEIPRFSPEGEHEQLSWSKRVFGSRRGRWLAVSLGMTLFLVVAGWPWIQEKSGEMVANYWLKQAAAELQNGDNEAALEHLERAAPLVDKNPSLQMDRARLRLELGKLDESLADYSRVIEHNPNFATAYTERSRVYQRQSKHAEALADLKKALQESPDSDPDPWNNLAYARALAGVELQEGLDDVQKAIQRRGEENAAYLDTRGYLYYLLDNPQAALADLNRALELTVLERDKGAKLAKEENVNPKALNRWLRVWEEAEAVMVQHRGLVHQKLGETQQAEADFERAKKMGYDPAAGVF